MEAQTITFLIIFSVVIYAWLFTKIPLFISGFLGVCACVFTGLTPAKEAFASFGHPIIFLFLGGFFFGKAMENLGLDKKLSLYILGHPLIRGRFNRIIFALFFLTAFFSMWMSNTATAAMMLPIVMGLISNLELETPELKTTIILGMAYSATIGGMGTPIGSPPNLVAIGLLKDLANKEVSFIQWSMYGMPLVVILLGLVYLRCLLIYKKSPEYSQHKAKKNEANKDNTKSIKPFELNLSKREKILGFFFTLLVISWFLPSLIGLSLGQTHPWTKILSASMNPGAIAIFFASLLFIFPLKSPYKILTMEQAKNIDWGSLFLFGSGISLGKVLFSTGLAQLIGENLVSLGGDHNFTFIVFIMAVFTIFLTELASNTASANILTPIAIAACLKLKIDPIIPALFIGMACNMAFMLPVATPPNAIVYGSGLIPLKTMAKKGILFNFICILLLALILIFRGVSPLNFY